MTAGTLTIRAGTLRLLVADVLEAAGTPGDIAAIVSDSLVLSSLRGVDSHGFARVRDYVAAIGRGTLSPAARPELIAAHGAILTLDGQGGFGQPGARLAAEQAIETVPEHGVVLATLRGAYHVGRVGEYVELPAERGLAAVAFCSSGPPGGLVAPHGGRRRALGTNPVAFGLPAPGRPIVGDFSTSTTAEGRVRGARAAGIELPAGTILDRAGGPSTNPADFYAGGSLLPTGGHKGYGLGLFVEILGGVFAGAGCACLGEARGNGLVLIVFDVERLLPLPRFEEEVTRVVDAMRGAPPADGVDAVLIPGDPEAETEALRTSDGIPVHPAIWEEFVQTAGSVGVEIADLPPKDD